MHIVCQKAQSVHIGDLELDFALGETIHTENCHKYSYASFENMSVEAGWRIDGFWKDEKNLFAVALLKPFDDFKKFQFD